MRIPFNLPSLQSRCIMFHLACYFLSPWEKQTLLSPLATQFCFCPIKINKQSCSRKKKWRAGLVQAVESYRLWPEGPGFESRSPRIAQARVRLATDTLLQTPHRAGALCTGYALYSMLDLLLTCHGIFSDLCFCGKKGSSMLVGTIFLPRYHLRYVGCCCQTN